MNHSIHETFEDPSAPEGLADNHGSTEALSQEDASPPSRGRRSSFSTIVLADDPVLSSHHDEVAEPRSLDYDRFRVKMHQKVCRLLRPVADETDHARIERLKALFNDLTCQVEDVVLSKVVGPSQQQGTLRQRQGDEDEEEPTEKTTEHSANTHHAIPNRYYQILAELYVEQPRLATELQLVGIPQLWNNVHFQVTFALVFYQWLFAHCYDDADRSIKFFAMLIKGTHKLFWLDLENGTRRFAPIHAFLASHILLGQSVTTSEHANPKNADMAEWQPGMLRRKYCELFDLVSKFYFYYHDTLNVDSFLRTCQRLMEHHAAELDRPAAHSKLIAINMFTNEVIRTMRLIKNEAALIQYVRCCSQLRGDKLAVPGRKTKLRLYSLLLDLATSGYPLYPTRDVKSAAQTTLRLLFPTPFPAWFIHFIFRLLRPLSFYTWTKLRISQLWLLVLTFIAWLSALVTSFVPSSITAKMMQRRSSRATEGQPTPTPAPSASPPSSSYRTRLSTFVSSLLPSVRWRGASSDNAMTKTTASNTSE